MSGSVPCPACGRPVPPGRLACPSCGVTRRVGEGRGGPARRGARGRRFRRAGRRNIGAEPEPGSGPSRGRARRPRPSPRPRRHSRRRSSRAGTRAGAASRRPSRTEPAAQELAAAVPERVIDERAAGGIVPGAYLPPASPRRPGSRHGHRPAPVRRRQRPHPGQRRRRIGLDRGTASDAGRRSILADLPFDAPDELEGWLVALGGGTGVLGFLLPWRSSFAGRPRGLLRQLGPGHRRPPADLRPGPHRRRRWRSCRTGSPSWVRTGVCGMIVGGMLLGLVWLYLGGGATEIGAILGGRRRRPDGRRRHPRGRSGAEGAPARGRLSVTRGPARRPRRSRGRGRKPLLHCPAISEDALPLIAQAHGGAAPSNGRDPRARSATRSARSSATRSSSSGCSSFAIYWVILWLAAAYWAFRDMQLRTENPILPYLASAFIVVFTPSLPARDLRVPDRPAPGADRRDLRAQPGRGGDARRDRGDPALPVVRPPGGPRVDHLPHLPDPPEPRLPELHPARRPRLVAVRLVRQGLRAARRRPPPRSCARRPGRARRAGRRPSRPGPLRASAGRRALPDAPPSGREGTRAPRSPAGPRPSRHARRVLTDPASEPGDSSPGQPARRARVVSLHDRGPPRPRPLRRRVARRARRWARGARRSRWPARRRAGAVLFVAGLAVLLLGLLLLGGVAGVRAARRGPRLRRAVAGPCLRGDRRGALPRGRRRGDAPQGRSGRRVEGPGARLSWASASRPVVVVAIRAAARRRPGALTWREMGLRRRAAGGHPRSRLGGPARDAGHRRHGGRRGRARHDRRGPPAKPPAADRNPGRARDQPPRRCGHRPGLRGAPLPRIRDDGLGAGRDPGRGDCQDVRPVRPRPRPDPGRRLVLRGIRARGRGCHGAAPRRARCSAGSSCGAGPCGPRSGSTRRSTPSSSSSPSPPSALSGRPRWPPRAPVLVSGRASAGDRPVRPAR